METRSISHRTSFLPDSAISPRLAGLETSILLALLRSTDHGILMTDHAGNDMFCNPRFGELFDIAPETVVRSTQAEVRRMALKRVKDPATFDTLMARIYADPLLEHEDEIEVKTEPPRILRRHTGPVLDAQGTNIGRFWTFEDVTEMRRLEAQVQDYAASLEEKVQRQAEALRAAQEKMLETARINAVGALAIGIAHDLRNIMSTLRLELDAAGDAECSKAVRAQLDRLTTLTHRLLSLSRPSTIHTGPLYITEVLDYLLSLVESQAEVDGITLRKRYQPEMPPVSGDFQRLEYLFINLLLNALNSMAAGGGTLTVSASHEHDEVRVDVKDTGEGIPQENMEAMFDPFFTTRANRAGLGLFSVKRIVEEHNGRIQVKSQQGKGSCFSVWLPVAAP